RRPVIAFPTISSDSPAEYTSAVSTKLMPASKAACMIFTQSSWSGLPHAPNIIAPRQSGLTWTPVRPSVRISMRGTLRAAPTPGAVGRPPGQPVERDRVDGSGRGRVAVLRVLRDQRVARPVRARITGRDDRGCARGAHPPQGRPVLVVVVDEDGG